MARSTLLAVASLALLAVVSAQVQAPAHPTFPKVYTATYMWSLPQVKLYQSQPLR